MADVTTVVLVGVGGQGTILAGDVIAKVAVAEGHDVKLSEVHGMAQRGGSVDTIVRFGECVFSPIIDPGVADHLIAFEITEAARRLTYLAPDGRLVVNSRTIHPLPVLTGAVPAVAGVEAALDYEGAVFIDAEAIACEAGSPRSANVVLLGAASFGLPFAEETWREVIASRVPPKTVEANLRAFELGRKACAEGACEL
ncbi:MAG: pyruvate ferredoxin oxidoreductase [Actinobacteria bacterium HGW-Actinobacteria-6]|jgi:indolepyruvate ferredoxin oxidoreductase beta subunit|nr:MAG: pyruvate ferredoxin oxidoreductase [Actinobacteria bacterium HGW-Actinobacteria-6]